MGSECLVILCVSWLTSYLCLSELTALLGKVFSNRLSEHRVLSEKTYIPPRHLHCDEWIKVRILDSMEMIRRKGQGQTGLSVPMACRARPPQEAPYLRPSQPRPSSRLAGCGLRSKSVMWLQRFLSNFFFQSLCASRTGSCFHFICLSHDTFRSGLRQNSYGSADREQTPALNQRSPCPWAQVASSKPCGGALLSAGRLSHAVLETSLLHGVSALHQAQGKK